MISNICGKITSCQPLSGQHAYRVSGDIKEDLEALDFLAGVNASKSLKTVMYLPLVLVLQLLQVLVVLSRVENCTDKTERQTFFAALLSTTSTVTDLR